jgi:hypothetical protein
LENIMASEKSVLVLPVHHFIPRNKRLPTFEHDPVATTSSVSPSTSSNGVKTVRFKNGKVLQFGLKSAKKLKTWQLVLGGAAGVLLVQHLIAPKGTSIVSKFFGAGSSGAEHTGHYVGAVNRGGYGGNSGMPFGPGPWPTQHAAAPIENGESPVRPTTLPQMPTDGSPEMAGWGHMEMPSPFGRGGPPFGLGYGGGGGHGGWPYGDPDVNPWWG